MLKIVDSLSNNKQNDVTDDMFQAGDPMPAIQFLKLKSFTCQKLESVSLV